MNDSPTPVYILFTVFVFIAAFRIIVAFARKLERERDQWRECAEQLAALPRGRCCDNGYCKKCRAALDKFYQLKDTANEMPKIQ